MSNYTKTTNFAVKDGYSTGNPSKVVKGTEIDDEFNAIASAISSKADTASPTFTGTPAAPTASEGTNTTQLATTAFVKTAVDTATGSLGTISTQDSDSVAITGGTLSGVSVVGSIEATALVLEGTTADAYETTIACEPTADRTITLPDATTTVVGTDTTQTLTNKTINASQLVDASVTPAKLSGGQSGSAPIYGVRAWVCFDGEGTTGTNQTIKASGNVTSVYKEETGRYTITLTTALADTNYAVVGSADGKNGGSEIPSVGLYGVDTKTTTSFQVRLKYPGSSGVNREDVSVLVMR